MVKCTTCGRFLSAKGGATCGNSVCHNRYHLSCLPLPEQSQISSDWLCPECRKRLPRNIVGATFARNGDPVGGVSSAAAASVVAASSVPAGPAAGQGGMVGSPVAVTQAKGSEAEVPAAVAKVLSRAGSEQGTDGEPSSLETQLTLREEIRLFRSELREVRDEMREFRREMAGLHSSMGACSERVDSLEARIEALETRQSAALPDAKVNQLERIVTQLQLELNDREQDLLGSDLEIANIPEVPGENVLHTVGLVAAKLGVGLDERDIVFAQRIGLRYDREPQTASSVSPAGGAGAAGAGAAPARARRIVVRLTRRGLRDDLLKSARVRRGATTADLGLPAPSRRFYVNERLTKTNRQLFYRVREAAGRLGWKYSWTKFGRILAKQGEGKPTYCIRSEEDFSRVFGREVSPENHV